MLVRVCLAAHVPHPTRLRLPSLTALGCSKQPPASIRTSIQRCWYSLLEAYSGLSEAQAEAQLQK